MQPIRLIAMDMDGTLLTHVTPGAAVIPPENAAVLRRCAEAGVHLALATGRMPDDAGFFARDAGLMMHLIALNGGILLDAPGGAPFDARYLPEDTARRVLDRMMAFEVDAAVFGPWEVVSMRDRPLRWAQTVLGTFFWRTGGRLRYRSNGDSLEAVLPRTCKLVALAGQDEARLADLKARIRAEFPDLTISSSWHDNFEVNPAQTDKGTALTALATRLGIPLSQVMAIGDNDNDLPMLRAAGVSVAMGNATDAARAAAKHVTLPCGQFGVAAAIRTLVFGETVAGVR